MTATISPVRAGQDEDTRNPFALSTLYKARPAGEEGQRLAVPRRGHVLSTVAETYGEPLRQAVSILSASFAINPHCPDLHASLFGVGEQQGNQEFARTPAEMAAWALIATWIIAVSTGALPATASLRNAEDWFFETEPNKRFTALLSDRAIKGAEAILHAEPDPSAYDQLLPYVLDPHGPGSRLSVRRDPRTRSARARKRAEGVFYTPADVAEFMVAASLESFLGEKPPTIFDPACGTGVFLRAALKTLRQQYPGKSAFALAAASLFGADIDPWPLDAAAFVLLADSLNDDAHQETPAALWRRIRANFACVDTLLVDPNTPKTSAAPADNHLHHSRRIPISNLFPALQDGPQIIVGNPPYADLGSRTDVASLGSTFATLAVKPGPSAEIYLPFIEQMVRLTSGRKRTGAFVLPLSIACNIGPQFTAARKLIAETPGTWRFAFFDREPHALFGEDVKTRNAIVLWSRSLSDDRAALATGPLRKWRGDHRAAMFQSLRFTPIGEDIRTGIPKIDGTGEAHALKVLNGRWSNLEQAVQDIRRVTLDQTPYSDDRTIFVGPTAYNFVNVFLKPPRGLLHSGQALSEHPLYAVTCSSRNDAFAVFAVLTSHLAYWWWHAHSDGFHVSRRFIASLPFGPEALTGEAGAELSASGSALWSAIREHPIISLNRGKTSLAYTPNGHDEIRRRADTALAALSALDAAFVDELQQFTAHTVAARLRGQATGNTNEMEGV